MEDKTRIKNKNGFWGLIKNFALRITSAFLSTGVRQFVILPVLARLFSDTVYGTILTINSVANITEVSLGNTLNNTRLITRNNYEETGTQGDFKFFLWGACGIGTLSAIVLPFVFPGFGVLTEILVWLTIVVGIQNAYYLFYYVMTLRFDRMMIQSVIVAVGTLIGAGITWLTHLWPCPFLLGNLLALVYIYKTAPPMRERFGWTKLASSTGIKWAILIATSLLSNALVYLDRLLLYPVLGGASVAIYTTASFFGKCIAAIMPPVANVLLGYFVQRDFQITRKKYLMISGASMGFGGLCFVASLPIAPWITHLMYPTLFESAAPLLVIANLASIISASATLSQTMILRYCKTSRLLVIQIIYGVVYLGGGLLSLSKYGISGFCYAVVAANTVKLIAMFGVGLYSIQREA